MAIHSGRVLARIESRSLRLSEPDPDFRFSRGTHLGFERAMVSAITVAVDRVNTRGLPVRMPPGFSFRMVARSSLGQAKVFPNPRSREEFLPYEGLTAMLEAMTERSGPSGQRYGMPFEIGVALPAWEDLTAHELMDAEEGLRRYLVAILDLSAEAAASLIAGI
jgi:hypothetical protein